MDLWSKYKEKFQASKLIERSESNVIIQEKHLEEKQMSVNGKKDLSSDSNCENSSTPDPSNNIVGSNENSSSGILDVTSVDCACELCHISYSCSTELDKHYNEYHSTHVRNGPAYLQMDQIKKEILIPELSMCSDDYSPLKNQENKLSLNDFAIEANTLNDLSDQISSVASFSKVKFGTVKPSLETLYPCPHCEIILKNKSDFQRHINMHCLDKVNNQDNCCNSIVNNLREKAVNPERSTIQEVCVTGDKPQECNSSLPTFNLNSQPLNNLITAEIFTPNEMLLNLKIVKVVYKSLKSGQITSFFRCPMCQLTFPSKKVILQHFKHKHLSNIANSISNSLKSASRSEISMSTKNNNSSFNRNTCTVNPVLENLSEETSGIIIKSCYSLSDSPAGSVPVENKSTYSLNSNNVVLLSSIPQATDASISEMVTLSSEKQVNTKKNFSPQQYISENIVKNYVSNSCDGDHSYAISKKSDLGNTIMLSKETQSCDSALTNHSLPYNSLPIQTIKSEVSDESYLDSSHKTSFTQISSSATSNESLFLAIPTRPKSKATNAISLSNSIDINSPDLYSPKMDNTLTVQNVSPKDTLLGYICCSCNKFFYIKVKFLDHFNSYHTGRKRFKIVLYNIFEKNEVNFKSDNQITKDLAYICKICQQYDNSETHIKGHMVFIHNTSEQYHSMRYKTVVARKTKQKIDTNYLDRLQNVNLFSQEFQEFLFGYLCQICNNFFKSSDVFVYHIVGHHPHLNCFQLVKYKILTENDLISLIVANNGNVSFFCKICYSYDTKEDVMKHHTNNIHNMVNEYNAILYTIMSDHKIENAVDMTYLKMLENLSDSTETVDNCLISKEGEGKQYLPTIEYPSDKHSSAENVTTKYSVVNRKQNPDVANESAAYVCDDCNEEFSLFKYLKLHLFEEEHTFHCATCKKFKTISLKDLYDHSQNIHGVRISGKLAQHLNKCPYCPFLDDSVIKLRKHIADTHLKANFTDDPSRLPSKRANQDLTDIAENSSELPAKRLSLQTNFNQNQEKSPISFDITSSSSQAITRLKQFASCGKDLVKSNPNSAKHNEGPRVLSENISYICEKDFKVMYNLKHLDDIHKFESEEDLNQFLHKKQSKGNELSLPDSTIKLKNGSAVESSLPSHHTCLICKMTFHSARLLDNHFKISKLDISCEICHFKTTSALNLLCHKANEHQIPILLDFKESAFTCSQCTYVIDSSSALSDHVSKAHQNLKYVENPKTNVEIQKDQESHKDKNLKSNTSQIIDTDTREAISNLDHKCSTCSLTIATYSNLLIHRRKSGHKLSCPSCDYRTVEEDGLIIHGINVHQMPYPHQSKRYSRSLFFCSRCVYVTAKLSSLRIHNRKHSDQPKENSTNSLKKIHAEENVLQGKLQTIDVSKSKNNHKINQAVVLLEKLTADEINLLRKQVEGCNSSLLKHVKGKHENLSNKMLSSSDYFSSAHSVIRIQDSEQSPGVKILDPDDKIKQTAIVAEEPTSEKNDVYRNQEKSATISFKVKQVPNSTEERKQSPDRKISNSDGKIKQISNPNSTQRGKFNHLFADIGNFAIKCEVCNKIFKNLTEMSRHRKQLQHYLNCSNCSYSTHEDNFYYAHLVKQHKYPLSKKGKRLVYKCYHCSYVAGIKASLLKHLKMKHDDLSSKIGISLSPFSDKSQISIHSQNRTKKSKQSLVGTILDPNKIKKNAVLAKELAPENLDLPRNRENTTGTTPEAKQIPNSSDGRKFNNFFGIIGNFSMKCEVCNKIFKNLTEMSRHRKQSQHFLKCSSCSYSTHEDNFYYAHLVKQHKRPLSKKGRRLVYKCPHCSHIHVEGGKTFLLKHLKMKHGALFNKVAIFPDKIQISAHSLKTKTSKESQYIMHHNKKSTRYSLGTLKMKAIIPESSSKLTPISTRTSLIKSTTGDFGEQPLVFSCEVCKNIFKSPLSLSNHRMSQKHFLNCNQCDYISPRISSYISHLYYRHGIPVPEKDMKYMAICPQCSNIFTRQSHLVVHLENNRCFKSRDKHVLYNGPSSIVKPLSSAKEPLLRCNICNLGFQNLSNLVEHRDSKQHQIKCNFCVYKTINDRMFYVHIHNYHDINLDKESEKLVSKCHYCSHVEADFISLQRHSLKWHKVDIIEVLDGNKLKCNQCNFTSTDLKEIVSHNLKIHQIKVQVFCSHCSYIYNLLDLKDVLTHLQNNHKEYIEDYESNLFSVLSIKYCGEHLQVDKEYDGSSKGNLNFLKILPSSHMIKKEETPVSQSLCVDSLNASSNNGPNTSKNPPSKKKKIGLEESNDLDKDLDVCISSEYSKSLLTKPKALSAEKIEALKGKLHKCIIKNENTQNNANDLTKDAKDEFAIPNIAANFIVDSLNVVSPIKDMFTIHNDDNKIDNNTKQNCVTSVFHETDKESKSIWAAITSMSFQPYISCLFCDCKSASYHEVKLHIEKKHKDLLSNDINLKNSLLKSTLIRNNKQSKDSAVILDKMRLKRIFSFLKKTKTFNSKLYICSKCNYKTTIMNYIDQHMKTNHNKNLKKSELIPKVLLKKIF